VKQLVFVAKRAIFKGEQVVLPLTVGAESDDVINVGSIETHDFGADGSGVVATSEAGTVSLALTPDVTPAEAAAMMRTVNLSDTVALEVPRDVKTAGDFFSEKMGRSIAEQIADRLYGKDPEPE